MSGEGAREMHRSLGLKKMADEELNRQSGSLAAMPSEAGACVKCNKAAGLEVTGVTCKVCKVWFLCRDCGKIKVRIGGGDEEVSVDCTHMKVLNAHKEMCFASMQFK